jgi:transposase-like protein
MGALVQNGAPSLRPGGDHALRALVFAVQAEPARLGGDDERARSFPGSHNHRAVGAALRSRVRESMETLRRGSRSVLRVDETYVKIRGTWCYLYRAVDRAGRTVDFRLSTHRDIGAAKAFFRKAIKGQGSAPKTITLDGYAASHRAVRELKADGLLLADTKVRSSKYLNNLIEQDHRSVKQRVAVMLGFKRFSNAAITITGIELMHRIRKEQFAVGHLDLQGQAAPAVWDAVLGS